MSVDKRFQSPNHPAGTGVAVPAQVYAARQFGKLLRSERICRGISRGEALEAMGLHPVHHDDVLQEIEAGTHELDVTWARNLQDRLGIPAVHLMVQAGVATLAQLAATADDMPLAGRPAPVSPPAVPSARPARQPGAGWRLAVTGGLVAGTTLMAAAVALVVLGTTASTLMLAWFALVAGWVCLTPALAHFTAWRIGRRRGR